MGYIAIRKRIRYNISKEQLSYVQTLQVIFTLGDIMKSNKRVTAHQSIIRWLSRMQTHIIYFFRHVFCKRGDKDMANEKVTFSSNNYAISAFFATQKVALPKRLYQDLLVFLSKACTYEEEERRIRPSLIIGHNLLDKQVKSIVQADIIVLAKDQVEKTHLSKRLKSRQSPTPIRPQSILPKLKLQIMHRSFQR